eukprot:454181_1
MEVVATRDILEGEEVFIDYGQDFEEAWEDYVLDWESPYEDNEKWTSAKELNDMLAPLRIAPDFSEKFKSTDNRGVFFTGFHIWNTMTRSGKDLTRMNLG